MTAMAIAALRLSISRKAASRSQSNVRGLISRPRRDQGSRPPSSCAICLLLLRPTQADVDRLFPGKIRRECSAMTLAHVTGARAVVGSTTPTRGSTACTGRNRSGQGVHLAEHLSLGKLARAGRISLAEFMARDNWLFLISIAWILALLSTFVLILIT